MIAHRLVRGLLVLGLLVLGVPGWGRADPPVVVGGAWARATAPGVQTGVVYCTLTSPRADRLVGVESAAAGHAGVHQETSTDGVMRMRPVAALDLPAGRPVTLAPGGLHIMLEGLRAPLRQGERLTVRLRFAHAAPVQVSVPVLAAGAAEPGMRGMDMDRGH